jgi:hypothetical protein
MNRFKINSSVIAIVLGLSAAFAFKAPAARHLTNPLWEYNGTTDPTLPSSYSPTTGVPCSGSDAICTIEAPANGSQPVISNELKTRIQNHDTAAGDVFLQSL